jgi:hypothetical protein
MEISLTWEGPHTFQYFCETPNPSPHPGVYIWVTEENGKYYIDYVGRALGSPNLGHRQQTHVANFLGLRYWIPSFHTPEGCPEWMPGSYPDNKIILFNEAEYLKIYRAARNYVSSISVYLAPMLDSSSDTIKIVERNLLFDLQPRTTSWGRKTTPSIQYSLKHKNALWAEIEICNEYMRPLQFA